METIVANNTTIAFKRTGSGPPLLLLHGAEADHSMFDAFGALLAPHFTVIAYDQRDSGETLNPSAPYGLAELGDDAGALIAALGYQRTHVFGTSLGGAIAQLLAARHPARIDRLVLSSTFRPGLALAEINPEEAPRIAALRSGLPGSAAEFAQYFYTPSYLAAHPEVVKPFRRHKAHRGTAAATRRDSDAAGRVRLSGNRRHATLVLAASEDRLIPKAHTLALARRDRRGTDHDRRWHWSRWDHPRSCGGRRGSASVSANRPNIKTNK